MDVTDEVLIWVNIKYVKRWFVQKQYSLEINNCSYISVTDNDQLNQQKM